MDRPVARYVPSKRYLSLTLFAICGAVFSVWVGLRWTPSWIAAALFALSAAGLSLIALRPVIAIYDTHLAIGSRKILWNDIRAIDQTGWHTPLAVYLTLSGGERFVLIYPGDFESSNSLLRHLRRRSREALLDGIRYRDFWGESASSQIRQVIEKEPSQAPPIKYPVLRPEDEEEVERMFQRLKSAGHIDSRSSHEE